MKKFMVLSLIIGFAFLSACTQKKEEPKEQYIVTINPSLVAMYSGEAVDFTAAAIRQDLGGQKTATDIEIEWQSSCGSIDKLGNNKIRYHSPSAVGTCEITATVNNDKATAKINVMQKASCNNPVNIPDANLQKAIKAQLKINRKINCDDLANLTTLEVKWVSNKPKSEYIASLQGLEYAVNLQRLSVAQTNISDLNPLQNLSNLKKLTIFIGKVQDLKPISKLVNMTHLRLDINEIKDISEISELHNLFSLGIDRNIDMKNLASLQSLKKLSHLSVASNSLTDISFLAKMTSIDYLLLYSNKITDISPLEKLIKLGTVYLDDNLIKDISPLLQNTGLNSANDVVKIKRNCLDTASGSQAMKDINTLKQRGVKVEFDNQRSECK